MEPAETTVDSTREAGAGSMSPASAGCACVLTDKQKAEIKRQVDKDFAEEQEWTEKFMGMTNSELGGDLGRLAGVLYRRRIISPLAFSLLINVQCRMQDPKTFKRVRHNTQIDRKDGAA